MELTLHGSRIRCLRPDVVTTGMVGAPVHFTFDDDWQGVTGRTAVFRCGGVEKQMVLDSGGRCTVPGEVLTVPGGELIIGVYGVAAGGCTWPAPTPFCSCGIVQRGASVADDALPPTPSLVQQLLNIAQSVRDDADAGRFQGEKGEKGDTGDTGATAYELAQAAGYAGTAAQFGEGLAAVADYAMNGWLFQPLYGDADSQAY